MTIDPNPLARGKSRWRWRFIGLALGLIVPAIAVGIWFAVQATVDRRLRASMDEATRDDPHWRLADLAAHREPIDDDENGAIVVAEVLDLLPEGWYSTPATPTAPPASPAAAVDQELEAVPENVVFEEALAARLRDVLDEVDDAVRLARTLVDYSRGRHEIEYAHNFFETPLSETQNTRTVARLLRLDAARRTLDGDLDGSLESCRSLLATARSIGDEPALISQLMRTAIDHVAVNSVRRTLAWGEPSEPALARLQALIEEESRFPRLLAGLRGERAGMNDVFGKITSGEISIDELSGSSQSGRPVRGLPPWGRNLFRYQQAIGLEWMNDAVSIARRPIEQHPALIKQWEARITTWRLSTSGKFLATLPILMSPALSSSVTASLRIRATLESTRLLIAAERHRLRTKAWPETIEAIDRDILPNPPIDPYSGRPMRILHRDGRLFVYSVGPNLRDDQGAIETRAKGTIPDDVGVCGWDVALRKQAPARPETPPEPTKPGP